MRKAVESQGNCAGIVLAMICFCAGIAFFFIIPVIGWICGPLICLGALFMGGKTCHVWKCRSCCSVVNRSSGSAGIGWLLLAVGIMVYFAWPYLFK